MAEQHADGTVTVTEQEAVAIRSVIGKFVIVTSLLSDIPNQALNNLRDLQHQMGGPA